MVDFKFITDERLRSLIERDKRELDKCLEHQLCKSTLLLAGSIIEAILVDFFVTFPRSNSIPSQVLQANLAILVEWAYHDGVITSKTKQLSTIVKDYRNLIHPGREYRLKERVDIHSAKVAASLVEIISQEIAENYARRRGYTAEQAINKVRLDPSCVPIFPHIVSTMIPTEKIKLFKIIPEVCQQDHEADFVDESFVKLHAVLKENIPQQVVKTEALNIYNYIRSRTRIEVIRYLRFFADNLDMLETDQREIVITYLLNMLKDGDEDELSLCARWGIYRQIGQFLDNEEGMLQLLDIILHQLYSTLMEEENDAKEAIFLSIVRDDILWSKMTSSRVETLINMLKEHHFFEEQISRLEIPF